MGNLSVVLISNIDAKIRIKIVSGRVTLGQMNDLYVVF